MPAPFDSPPLSRKHQDDAPSLSHLYRDTQLSGGVLSMSHATDLQKRMENPTFPYRDRGDFGLRRW